MWKNSGGTPSSISHNTKPLSRIFNNISKTSEIPLKSDYALFKQGVRPEWEDSANEKGGKWSFQFKRNADIDELWLYTVQSSCRLTLIDLDARSDW